MQVPLDTRLRELTEVPYTINFVIRKRQQLDNLNELPKEKRPPDDIIWDDTPEALDEWLERAFSDGKKQNEIEFKINPKDIEG